MRKLIAILMLMSTVSVVASHRGLQERVLEIHDANFLNLLVSQAWAMDADTFRRKELEKLKDVIANSPNGIRQLSFKRAEMGRDPIRKGKITLQSIDCGGNAKDTPIYRFSFESDDGKKSSLVAISTPQKSLTTPVGWEYKNGVWPSGMTPENEISEAQMIRIIISPGKGGGLDDMEHGEYRDEFASQGSTDDPTSKGYGWGVTVRNSGTDRNDILSYQEDISVPMSDKMVEHAKVLCLGKDSD